MPNLYPKDINTHPEVASTPLHFDAACSGDKSSSHYSDWSSFSIISLRFYDICIVTIHLRDLLRDIPR